ncbi:hypothetical protein I4641_12290 [Waterburya agarophytonicola K14]|uniref:Uncharacterized protein n=1 Tax=Waterburya agarophytonicola KI4 TaxID=2874699 RepID=A0A964BR96_9CYAN|nr:hypothetical protein [Waterburya agarophytonicola]MCC0177759.1 hypothetical protein [Waterburya agarophytonicola KI4]
MLQGIELINCAKASAKQGIIVAAQNCGYAENIGLFIENLNKACQEIGVNISELNDLITDQQVAQENRKIIEISPIQPTSYN